ncbi:MAG TPA: YggT family protein [Rhizomicrobium sp.]|jgi:YggT family protein
MLNPISALLLYLIEIYTWIIIAAVVVSWLIAFRVINVSNQIVRSFVSFLYAITEPVFRQVRRFVPAFGGIDISPVIVLIALWFISYVITWVSFRYTG